ncbi:MAG: alpha/beta fold hydrolase [Acidimicrobiales bacterium]
MLEKGAIDSSLVSGPVDYSMIRPGTGPSRDLPIVLWLHGGGGSARFLETCQAQFVTCWTESSLPDLAVVTPSAGWSFYLDQPDGERWESFLLDELVPEIREVTGSRHGPLVIGGISIGATAALRIAFRRPELISAVVAIEPTIESATSYADVPLRDRVQIPSSVRSRLWGDPVDEERWRHNHPLVLAETNSSAIAAAQVAIYLECGDQDLFHAQYGTELLHRHLFDAGISHEYRLVRGGNHVGPSVGPRVVDALRFVGRVLKPTDYPPDSLSSLVEVETFAAQVRELESAAGYRQTQEVRGPDCKLTVHAQGEGPTVMLLPSLGRAAADFVDLADRLAKNGFRVLRPEPRGVVGSSSLLNDLTLNDFADDAAAVIEEFGAPATVIGHDFGGEIAQMVGYLYPDLVSSLVLLAPPGPVQPKREPATALRRVFIRELSDEEHLEAIALALFAEGNDPVVWVNGWHPTLAFAQAEAERHVAPEDLWGRLRAKSLVLQPTEDRIVLAENAQLMADRLGDLVTVVEIPNAGHALLPEQPEAVAIAILAWLRAQG